MDEQGTGASASTTNATANAGAVSGENTQKTETYTAADLQREADRRVNEAQKKWKEQLDATVADKTRDAETKLFELTAKAEEAERYAGFIETATTSGIRNIKAAYLVAKGGEYLGARGKFDADRFRKENPEFYAPAGNANAGSGAGTTTKTSDMNAFIRAAAGV